METCIGAQGDHLKMVRCIGLVDLREEGSLCLKVFAETFLDLIQELVTLFEVLVEMCVGT